MVVSNTPTDKTITLNSLIRYSSIFLRKLSTLKDVEVLKDLGLTLCQAKVYLALCRFEILDAKTVSKYAGVPRPDVYRITSELIQLGLIEKVISRPTNFRAIPVDKVTSILLRRRKEETCRLESNTRGFLEKFKTNNKEVQFGKTEFVLVPKNEAVVERVRSLIDNAQRTIDIVSSWKRFSRFLSFAEVIEKAWSKGVKSRIIVEIPEKGRASDLVLNFCEKSTFCEVRFVPSPPQTVMSIYDKKEILIALDPKTVLSGSPALWSSNCSLLMAIQDYFDILWLTSLKDPLYNLDVEQV